jgi:hypothetical protein
MQITSGTDLDIVTRFYMAYTGTPPTAAQLNTFCSAVATAWDLDLAPVHTTEKTLVAVTAEDLTSATSAVGAATVSFAGTEAGTANPAGTAFLLNYHIARRYRGGKPRSYMPWLSQAALATPQTWATASLNFAVTSWNSFITAVRAAPWAGGTLTGQVNVSYYSGFTNYTGSTGRNKVRSTVRATVPTPDVIQTVSGNTRVASQRRRNRP